MLIFLPFCLLLDVCHHLIEWVIGLISFSLGSQTLHIQLLLFGFILFSEFFNLFILFQLPLFLFFSLNFSSKIWDFPFIFDLLYNRFRIWYAEVNVFNIFFIYSRSAFSLNWSDIDFEFIYRQIYFIFLSINCDRLLIIRLKRIA